MKILITILSLALVATNVFAERTYHPHIQKVEVSFESGDQILFFTKYNTAKVVGIQITSRGGVEYSVPAEALKEIKAPRLNTLRITFHDAPHLPYKEGSFVVSFDHDGSSPHPGIRPDVEFFFEDGGYLGGFDAWSSYLRAKENEAQQGG